MSHAHQHLSSEAPTPQGDHALHGSERRPRDAGVFPACSRTQPPKPAETAAGPAPAVRPRPAGPGVSGLGVGALGLVPLG